MFGLCLQRRKRKTSEISFPFFVAVLGVAFTVTAAVVVAAATVLVV